MDSYIEKIRTFEYYQTTGAPPEFQQPGEEQLKALTAELDDWFEGHRRGRSSRVIVGEQVDGAWFLIRHGEPLKREESMHGTTSSSVCFRPRKYDVLLPDRVRRAEGSDRGSRGAGRARGRVDLGRSGWRAGRSQRADAPVGRRERESGPGVVGAGTDHGRRARGLRHRGRIGAPGARARRRDLWRRRRGGTLGGIGGPFGHRTRDRGARVSSVPEKINTPTY